MKNVFNAQYALNDPPLCTGMLASSRACNRLLRYDFSLWEQQEPTHFILFLTICFILLGLFFPPSLFASSLPTIPQYFLAYVTYRRSEIL